MRLTPELLEQVAQTPVTRLENLSPAEQALVKLQLTTLIGLGHSQQEAIRTIEQTVPQMLGLMDAQGFSEEQKRQVAEATRASYTNPSFPANLLAEP